VFVLSELATCSGISGDQKTSEAVSSHTQRKMEISEESVGMSANVREGCTSSPSSRVLQDLSGAPDMPNGVSVQLQPCHRQRNAEDT
jgi:hypothetical protein